MFCQVLQKLGKLGPSGQMQGEEHTEHSTAPQRAVQEQP
jgi:hypothetical protein